MDQWARVLSLQHWDLSLNPSTHTGDSAWLNTCVTPAIRCRTEEGESWLARHRAENGNLQYSERSSPKAMFQSQRMTQCPVLDSGPHAYSWVHTVTWTPHSPSTYTSTIFKTREMAQGVKYLCLNLQSPDKVRHMVAAVYNPNVVMVTWEAETRQFLEALGPAAGILQGQTEDQFRQGGRDHQLSDLYTCTHTKYFQTCFYSPQQNTN